MMFPPTNAQTKSASAMREKRRAARRRLASPCTARRSQMTKCVVAATVAMPRMAWMTRRRRAYGSNGIDVFGESRAHGFDRRLAAGPNAKGPRGLVQQHEGAADGAQPAGARGLEKPR